VTSTPDESSASTDRSAGLTDAPRLSEDLVDEVASVTVDTLRAGAPVAVPFDPAPARERLRGYLAIWIMAILSATLVAVFVLMWIGRMDAVVTFGQIVITPVFTLTGAVTGFYFGSQQGSSRGG
jgi:hypothetical protein